MGTSTLRFLLNARLNKADGFTLTVMTKCVNIDLAHLPVKEEFVAGRKTALSTIDASFDWGRYNEQRLHLQQLCLATMTIDVKEGYRLRTNGKHDTDYLHLCVLLHGDVVYKIDPLTLEGDEKRRQVFRLAYSREEDYLADYSDRVSLIHLAIHSEYYTRLLSEREVWSANLKEKILGKELVFQKNTLLPPAMLQCMRDMLSNPFHGDLHAIMMEAKVMELIAWQLQCYADKDSTAAAVTRKDAETFHALREYLDKNFMAEHSLKDLSRRFALNEFKLKAGFKQMFQKTVFGYIIEKRLDHAYRLIVDTDQPMVQVGSMTGYKNQCHFSTAFKKQFGFSPKDLRRQSSYAAD